MTTTETRLSLQQFAERWDDLANVKGPLICSTTSTFADLKGVIEKLCSDHEGACSVDQTEAIYQLSKKIDKAIELAKKANGTK